MKSGYLVYKIAGVEKPDTIGGFAFVNALCGDYPNCMHNAPAMYDLIAGKRSEVWVIDATILPRLFEEDHQTCRQGRLFMEAAYVSLVKRYYALYAKTPMERYVDLITEHPQIQQDVPQKEIAKYLQIDPVTLCRFRKELLKQ